MVCHLIYEVDGTSACNPGPSFPVESCRPHVRFHYTRRMAAFQVLTVTSLEHMRRCLDVRRRVFIEEQQVPESIEIDEYDGDPAMVRDVFHVLVIADGAAVATGRLLLHPDEHGRVHIGRVAVLAEQRRAGYGRAVMDALHALAMEHGIRDITLAAQLHAIPFYERLGYVLREGEVFLDAGIEHRWMDISVSSPPGTP
jgi:predicted GNAT family N-acyltransferase